MFTPYIPHCGTPKFKPQTKAHNYQSINVTKPKPKRSLQHSQDGCFRYGRQGHATAQCRARYHQDRSPICEFCNAKHRSIDYRKNGHGKRTETAQVTTNYSSRRHFN